MATRKKTSAPPGTTPAADRHLPAASDPLAVYLKQISRYPLIDRETERELAIRVHDHQDVTAAQDLVRANLRFVVKIAFQYVKYGAKVLDLIQEGNLGLLRAVREFDPYKDTRLSTYAVWWIRSYMQDFLLRNWSIVRIGTTKAQKKLFYRLKKEQERLEREGISPIPAAIAMNLGVHEDDVTLMQNRMAGKDASIDQPRGGGEESRSWASQISDEQPLASAELEKSEQAELFKKALAEFVLELDERERDIFDNSLMAETPETLVAIGERYGFSKERARQLEERIKNKLKDFLSKNYPDISVD
jgi:RNA polymerase sigma-32 factor